MYGLVDCNNFYTSCEHVFNPKLEGKPIGVLSNNDGCVIARSNELKLYISIGMPAFKIPSDIKKRIILLSSNYELNRDMRERLFSIVLDYIYDTEIYSINEAFLNSEKQSNYIGYCHLLRKKVRQCTGIPVSIGISPTKTLAKIANHIVKKNPQHQGIYFLNTDDLIFKETLKAFPIEEIWGVGRKLSAKLNAMGIQTSWELRNSDASHLGKMFSVVLERTVLELRGISCIELDTMDTPKKNIMTSRSFGKATKELFEVQEALRVHASRGAEKLRAQNSLAQAVLVFLRTNRFSENQPQYHPSIAVPLLYPSNDTRQIIEAVQSGLKRKFKKNYLYQKAGVMMLDLVDKDNRQLDFLSAAESETTKARNETLMQTLDKINQKMGRNTVAFGGINKNASWNLKRELVSKRYTTNWDELPVVKVY